MSNPLEPNYPIRSVDRALELLLMFRHEASVTVSDVAARLEVSRSTAHRMLAMLAHRRFVQQDPRTKRYLGGPALVDVGLATVRNMDIRHRARPYVEALVAEVGETAHLHILQGRSVVFIDGVEGSHALRAAQRSGVSLPAHCTAGGKALLADVPLADLRALYANGESELGRMTERSVGSFEELLADLELVQERGWAFNDEESEAGLRAVAVALPASAWDAPMRAAIAVAGPAFRMEDDRLESIAAAIKRTADEVTAGGEGDAECASQALG